MERHQLTVMKILIVALSCIQMVKPDCGVPYHKPYFSEQCNNVIPDEGAQQDDSSRLAVIVHGCQAVPHSYPWMVSLQYISGNRKHLCGGTIIQANQSADQSDIIVTAAHCYDNVHPTHVLLGVHNWCVPEAGHKLVPIAKHVLHPDYNKRTNVNDIAILKLAEPVTFSNSIKPACLPKRGEKLEIDTKGLVAGWGINHYEKSPSELYQAIVPVYDTEKCKEANLSPYPVNHNISFCAGYHKQGEMGTCTGDSGGPWLANQTGRYVLHGITSFGTKGLCAVDGYPDVFTRVSTYLDWIEKQVKD